MPLLFVIDDTFAVKERGVVAVGKLADPHTARYRINDPVEIRRKDGSVVHTVISGIPMGIHTAGKAEVLLRGLSGLEIGLGDQVWISDASCKLETTADAYDAEIKRRIEWTDSGDVELISHDEVQRRLGSKYGKKAD